MTDNTTHGVFPGHQTRSCAGCDMADAPCCQDSSQLQTHMPWKCKTTPSYRRELSSPRDLSAIDTGYGDHEVTQKICNDLCQKWALNLISGKLSRTQNVEYARASHQLQKNNNPSFLTLSTAEEPLNKQTSTHPFHHCCI